MLFLFFILFLLMALYMFCTYLATNLPTCYVATIEDRPSLRPMVLFTAILE